MKKNTEKKTMIAKVRGRLETAEKNLIALVAAFMLQTVQYVSADNGQAAPAAGTAKGDSSGFNSVLDTVLNWGGKAGLAVVMVGGIMFAFSFKNNDAEQKTSAIQTMIAGIIVTGVCALGRSGFGLG